MEINIYPMLKKSRTDSNCPSGYTKIGIQKEEKIRSQNSFMAANSYNGIKLTYCSIGMCSSEKKFCHSYFDNCPYKVVKNIKQPRKNSKEFEQYETEFKLQMAAALFKNHFTEEVEKAIYGELPEDEYKILVRSMSYNLSKEMTLDRLKDYVIYGTFIHDIYIYWQVNKKQQFEKNKKEKCLVYDVGDYFYIDMPHLPEINDGNGSLWWRIGWVKKKNFTADFLIALEHNTSLQYWLREEYNENIKHLKNQLEEKYGMMTLLTLQGYQ